MMRVGLVGCVKSKARRATRAKDLYQSPLFAGGRAAVEENCDRWFILSAKHGLLDPDETIEPYDETLGAFPVASRRQWSRRVTRQLHETLGSFDGVAFEVHAGRNYYEYGLRSALVEAGATVEIPPEGLSLGPRLAYYAHGTRRGAYKEVSTPMSTSKRTSRKEESASEVTPAGGAPRTKYVPLYHHLIGLDGGEWSTTFAEIEDVLGFPLPSSARNHQAWWANESTTHSHAQAWLAAGYRTTAVNLTAEHVTFRPA